MADRGFVSLIGAGPGDPGLMTLRGLRAIERADVVLYDHLASPAVLGAVDVPGQERIHVGKIGGGRRAPQEAINALIVRRAAAGQRVARVKGGDPFVLGRGAEEAEACRDAGIPFEVIPGVSSAVAAPAYAGIPVTHRDVASGLTLATGHEREGADDERLRWAQLADPSRTLIVLMGVRRVAAWTSRLLGHGVAADTPVAFIASGTLPRQQTLVTTLGEAADAVGRAKISAPAVAIVGAVVRYRERLEWFERRPLFGQVIGLTHAVDGRRDAWEALEDLGALVVHVPLTRIGPTAEATQLIGHLRAGAVTDLVITSANGARALRGALDGAGMDGRALAGIELWTVGPATAAEILRILRLRPEHVPEDAGADGLIAIARDLGVTGRRFLFPASASRIHPLAAALEALGAEVITVPSYTTARSAGASARLLSAVEAGLTLLTVAGPVATDALAAALKEAGLSAATVPVAAIGPRTAEAARRAGLKVVVVADEGTTEGLAAAIIRSLPA